MDSSLFGQSMESSDEQFMEIDERGRYKRPGGTRRRVFVTKKAVAKDYRHNILMAYFKRGDLSFSIGKTVVQYTYKNVVGWLKMRLEQTHMIRSFWVF